MNQSIARKIRRGEESTEKPRGQRRLITGLSWFLALQLFLFAPMKFYPHGAFGYPSYLEKFAAWGYPAWFTYLIGAAELLAGILLVLPRRRFLGSAIMMFIMPGAIATHIINHDKIGDAVAAPYVLALSTIIALMTWPASWRDPIVPPRQPRI